MIIKSLSQPGNVLAIFPYQQKKFQMHFSGNSVLSEDRLELNSKQINIKQGNLTKGLQIKINDIISNPQTNIPIGIGGTAKVYKYEENGNNYAIKIANAEHNTSMTDGVNIMSKLPDSMKEQGQSLIAYGEIKGREFIVTNLVKGSSEIVPKEKKQLQSFLLGNLLELDKAGIMHQDLWMPNIMVDGDNVNLIDYDYAKEYNPLTAKDNRQPEEFVLNSNLFDFEVSGMETYINALRESDPEEVKQFFTNYLEVKSEFHSQHADFIEEQLMSNVKQLSEKDIQRILNNIQYERVMSKVLQNPSAEIINLEAQRIQMLYAFNWSNKNAYFKKPTDSVQCWMRTIIYANKYKNSVNELLNKTTDKNMKEYLTFQSQYADFYTKTFGDWGRSTINWLLDVFTSNKELSDYDKEVYNNGIENPMTQLHQGFKQYADMTDLYQAITDSK